MSCLLRIWRVLAASSLAAALLAGAAAAEAPDDCPTWFPDFRCERSGRWEGFHKPILAPYLFEDPFITTGVYPYYLWHDFPNDSAFQGGSLHAMAVQARVALTDRLGFVAAKDALVFVRPDNDILDDEDGLFNLVAGLKYALIQDRDAGYIVTPALRFEVPTGASDVFQGYGDGEAIPSVSAAWGKKEWNVMANFGGRIPFNQHEQGNQLFYQLYGAWNVAKHLAPFIQLSGIHYLTSGDGKLPVDTVFGELELDTATHALGLDHFEGVDVVNLGSRGVDGNDFIALGIGAHVPLTEHITFSVGYERPITGREDIFDQRVTSNLMFEF
jgi:hypothetical protein